MRELRGYDAAEASYKKITEKLTEKQEQRKELAGIRDQYAKALQVASEESRREGIKQAYAATKQEEQEKKEQILRQSADEGENEMLRSLAVNEDVVKKNAEPPPHERVKEYIEQIQEEIDSDYGGRYRANKNKHYKEDSIRAQRDKKERMLDSLQSTVYVGKSSVSYNIKGRYKTYLPIPVYKCEFGGKIVVAVVVNRQGRVVKAEVVDTESDKDDALREVAVDVALKSEFNADEKAPERQAGTITYNFVKQ